MTNSYIEHTRKKREKARVLGMCIVCCSRLPENGLSTCPRCIASAKIRVQRVRCRRRDQQIALLKARRYEAEGEALLARSRRRWTRAGSRFKKALAICTDYVDKERLCAKIGFVTLSQGARPEKAAQWIERASERNPHYVQPRLRWFQSRTQEALADFTRLEDAAPIEQDNINRHRWFELIAEDRARYCILLGRYSEAAKLIRGMDSAVFGPVERWIFEAALGSTKHVFEEFTSAPASSKSWERASFAPGGWDQYSDWALALGRLDVARVCRERTLLVARKYQLAWRIPYINLRFFSLHIVAGDYNQAQHFLTEALLYETESPFLRVLKTIVGLELAHAVGDMALLKRMYDESIIDDAFTSGEPQRIANACTAFAKVAIARRQFD